MPQEAEVEEEAEEASEIEAAEVAVVEEVEDQEVSEEETKTDGLHSPSSVDSSRTTRSNPSRRSTPTPSQSRRLKSLNN
jgi:hypothetical protein